MMTAFDKAYIDVACAVLGGTTGYNKRTRQKTISTHGQSFFQQGLPLLTLRDIEPKRACIEAVWFLSGCEDPTFMRNLGAVPLVYDSPWRTAFGVDQLLWAIYLLKSMPTTRRCFINTWNPIVDDWLPSIGRPKPTRAPSVASWHLYIDGGQLNVSVFQRACDIWHGLPITITTIGLVQALIARHLELGLGSLFLTISNAHLYESQRESLKKLLARVEQRQGSQPNHVLTLPVDMLPAAMKAQTWVVHDLALKIGEFYDTAKGASL